MSRNAALSRRWMLAAGLSFIAVWCGYIAGGVQSNGPANGGWSPRRVVDAVLPNVASAQAIGDAYLRAGRVEEASAELLMSLIFSGQLPAVANEAQFKTYIAHRLQRDFADGAVVKVNGWMLSVTEARLCALAAVAAG